MPDYIFLNHKGEVYYEDTCPDNNFALDMARVLAQRNGRPVTAAVVVERNVTPRYCETCGELLDAGFVCPTCSHD